ncbi:hypothetical protein JCGZ_06903 [Jatropha curcas]|uniref:Uncharacterized protein n=1 Tax=Jatropha curcas TaxID=180498 RepID=A0A067KZK0_JATCU|nr:hypothetical protein JCGZ_06903 [Jatropha curcas]
MTLGKKRSSSPRKFDKEDRTRASHFRKIEKLDKKLEKLHVFMKSKQMDQYVDINDDDDEELEVKHETRLTYKMPKVAKYDGTGDPKVHLIQYKPVMELWVCHQEKF